MFRIVGFSLLEILLVCTLSLIVLLFIIPSQKLFIHNNSAKISCQQLLQAINLTKTEAILRGTPTHLCKSADQKSCSGDWCQGYIIATGDEILFHFAHEMTGKIYWRAFPINRSDLQFLPSGRPNTENGTFWYCEKNAKNPQWAIVMSASGRIRVLTPTINGQIYDEKGLRLAC